MTGPGNPRPTNPPPPATEENAHGGLDRDRAPETEEGPQAAGLEAAGVDRPPSGRPAIQAEADTEHVVELPAVSPALSR